MLHLHRFPGNSLSPTSLVTTHQVVLLLQIASKSFLVIGAFALTLTICLILFEDQWVTGIVSKFLKKTQKIESASTVRTCLFDWLNILSKSSDN